MTIEQLPPHDMRAEEMVLATLMVDGDLIQEIQYLEPLDFYHEVHGIIFKVCLDLFHRGTPVNKTTVATEEQRLNKLEYCGGVSFLSLIESHVETVYDIKSYAGIVHNLSISRQLIVLGEQCSKIGYSANPDNKVSIQSVYDMITDFKKRNMAFEGIVTPKEASDIMFNFLNEYNKPSTAIKWGYQELDEITSGIYPAELVVIGARPSVGKTQLMLDVAENVDKQNKIVMFCSVEMSMKHILERRVARELGVSVLDLRNRALTEDEKDKLIKLTGENSVRHVYYMRSGASSSDILNEAQKLKDNVGLDIIFIDYLQFLQDCWLDGHENQNVRVGKACKTLKTIANELNIPVIVASQLNRGLEHRNQEDRHPSLADLRDSGNIEQDADVVLLLDRIINNNGGSIDNTTLEVKMAKNRQIGSMPAVNLKYSLESRRYESIKNPPRKINTQPVMEEPPVDYEEEHLG
jgi:replicative DNA helicase